MAGIWCEYHGADWMRLVEQGWMTWTVEERGGTRWAWMVERW